jgi:hypothetical protein
MVTFAGHKGGNSLAYSLQRSAEDADLPLVDFVNADNPAMAQKARKRSHSLRQDKAIAELPAGVEPLPIAAHQLARLPALPVAQSNVVVLGDITERSAILTDDKLGVYSEFSIHLVKIFKDDQSVLAVGGLVEASRLGGAVRFPSGRIQRYTVSRVSRQGYPQQGKVYVLFLKRDEDGDFSILTGYELGSTMVNPLDGDPRPGNDLQFGIYRGVKQELFLTELQKALRATSGGGD